MNVCFENVKVTSIDAQAIERAIATWCLPKEQGGRGLSQRTVAKVLTTMRRIFKFGIRNRCGVEVDPTNGLRKARASRPKQGRQALYTGLHEVTEKEVLTPQEAKQVVLAARPGVYRTII